MADVSNPDSISAVPAAPSGPGRESRDHPEGRESPPEDRARPPRNIADVALVMGIPEAELTPKVRAALAGLMAEFDRQRAELARLRERIGQLEALADRDPLLPIRNRRALERDIAHVQASASRSQLASSFLCLGIENLDAIRAVHGRGAAEAALAHVVRVVAAELREVDVLGSLGTGDLGVILALTQGAAAERKADDIVGAIGRQAFGWRGGIVELKMRAGLAVIEPGVPAEAVFDRAEPRGAAPLKR